MGNRITVLILAGGYGKRLEQSLPIECKDVPKGLLSLDGKCNGPLENTVLRCSLDYIIDNLKRNYENIELNIVLSTNQKFSKKFWNFIKFYEDIRKDIYIRSNMIVENHNEDENKMGSIGGLYYAIKNSDFINKEENDGIYVLFSDNLFENDKNIDLRKSDNIYVIGVKLKDIKKATRYGNIILEEINGKKYIKDFVEKPKEPLSQYVLAGLIYIPKKYFGYVEKYLNENQGKEKADKFGYFISWLVKKSIKIEVRLFDGEWLDIGDKESYERSKEEYKLFC